MVVVLVVVVVGVVNLLVVVVIDFLDNLVVVILDLLLDFVVVFGGALRFVVVACVKKSWKNNCNFKYDLKVVIRVYQVRRWLSWLLW